MPVLNLQIFGTRKCQDTRSAERWWKERRQSFQLVDLSRKGLSPGELRAVAAKVGGVEILIDRAGARYRDRGLLYAAPTGPRIEQILIDDALLLRTPIIRCSAGATVGFSPEIWLSWL